MVLLRIRLCDEFAVRSSSGASHVALVTGDSFVHWWLKHRLGKIPEHESIHQRIEELTGTVISLCVGTGRASVPDQQFREVRVMQSCVAMSVGLERNWIQKLSAGLISDQEDEKEGSRSRSLEASSRMAPPTSTQGAISG